MFWGNNKSLFSYFCKTYNEKSFRMFFSSKNIQLIFVSNIHYLSTFSNFLKFFTIDNWIFVEYSFFQIEFILIDPLITTNGMNNSIIIFIKSNLFPTLFSTLLYFLEKVLTMKPNKLNWIQFYCYFLYIALFITHNKLISTSM